MTRQFDYRYLQLVLITSEDMSGASIERSVFSESNLEEQLDNTIRNISGNPSNLSVNNPEKIAVPHSPTANSLTTTNASTPIVSSPSSKRKLELSNQESSLCGFRHKKFKSVINMFPLAAVVANIEAPMKIWPIFASNFLTWNGGDFVLSAPM